MNTVPEEKWAESFQPRSEIDIRDELHSLRLRKILIEEVGLTPQEADEIIKKVFE